ncbi:hypothetical protein ASPCADRAFT_211244 [Aspergillus carbonarius ITEM 5010]|uniref:Uncharacterized protein n=1 Tax=Aspergillus carbonarius (strain ITEM 5010) TaxID=602072 RepID=A0A1R3RAC9_ASPC5|nr:hypothetical protein ASPCADRAFT_211244 [Aspergillus carbonarius ITEM 5010]
MLKRHGSSGESTAINVMTISAGKHLDRVVTTPRILHLERKYPGIGSKHEGWARRLLVTMVDRDVREPPGFWALSSGVEWRQANQTIAGVSERISRYATAI